MKEWQLVVAISLPVVILLLIGLLLLWMRKWRSSRRDGTGALAFGGITSKRLRGSYHFQHLHSRSFHEARRGNSAGDFSWVGPPAPASEAPEGGRSRFAFSGRHEGSATLPAVSRDSTRPSASPPGVVEVMHPATSEFMQVLRLSPRETAAAAATACVWMDSPVPGRVMKKTVTSFPQAAYFEITILYLRPLRRGRGGGDGRVTGIVGEDAAGGGATGVITLGLTGGGGGFSPDAVPGRYSGSIGFDSNGAVYLEGKELVSPSDGSRWGAVNRVIGCGFTPGKKRVIFTVDSNLVHVIYCTSDAFGSPPHPCFRADEVDVMVMVNLGQKPFRYAAANSQRAPPPPGRSHDFGEDGFGASDGVGYRIDSGELFSLRRTGSRCPLNGSGTGARDRGSVSDGSDGIGFGGPDRAGEGKNKEKKSREDRSCDDGTAMVGVDAESDLFEISLDC